MFRAGASRALLRSSLNASSPSVSQPAFRALNAPIRAHLQSSQLCTLARRPQVLAAMKPWSASTIRGAASGPPMDKIDKKAEQEIAKKALPVEPELVSSNSSVHPVLGEVGLKESGEREADMMAGVRSDMQTIKDTFSLEAVPRQAYYVGMAGVIPYAATSLSTVWCAYEISHGGVLMSPTTAELLLHIIEPLQVGYGAVIISFLGAIHWGLEWAKYGGEQGYPRYSIGIISTALAWPTILMPVEYALISQFLIFNFLYYTDSRACKNAWTPAWYAVYRFVLTFVVGAAIVVSLIGRGQIADQIGRLPGPADRVKQFREHQEVRLAEEEETRRKFLASKDEEEEEDAEEEGEGEGEKEEE